LVLLESSKIKENRLSVLLVEAVRCLRITSDMQNMFAHYCNFFFNNLWLQVNEFRNLFKH